MSYIVILMSFQTICSTLTMMVRNSQMIERPKEGAPVAGEKYPAKFV